jgi:hypothetical protein
MANGSYGPQWLKYPKTGGLPTRRIKRDITFATRKLRQILYVCWLWHGNCISSGKSGAMALVFGNNLEVLLRMRVSRCEDDISVSIPTGVRRSFTKAMIAGKFN